MAYPLRQRDSRGTYPTTPGGYYGSAATNGTPSGVGRTNSHRWAIAERRSDKCPATPGSRMKRMVGHPLITAPYTPRGGGSYSTSTRGGGTFPTRGPGRPPNSSYIQQQAPPVPQGPPTYYRVNAFPPGPLPFFLDPPGQSSLDPTLPPPVSQAQYTTYPSRMRTGVTGLIQPETITGGPRERDLLLAELDRELAAARSGSGASTPMRDSPAPFKRPPLTSTGSGARRRGAVNYAEKASDDEDEEEEEDDLSEVHEAASDPEDFDYGSKATRRRGDRDARDASVGTPGARTWANMDAFQQQATIRAGKLKRKKDDMERGFTWLGDRVPGERVKSRRKQNVKLDIKSDELLAREANSKELLVPITIDLDLPGNDSEPGIKIKDRFLWNVNEKYIRPATFAVTFCDDLGIPAEHARTIEGLIRNQIEEAQASVMVDVVDPEVTPDDVVWSEDEVEVEATQHATVDKAETPRANGDSSTKETRQNQDEAEQAEAEEEAEPEPEVKVEQNWKEADCRIIINLDVQIYTHILRDRIEWDLSSPLPPSIFAKAYCQDLGLTGEAVPLIAHAITDELLKHKRDALELDLFSRTHPEEQAKWEKTAGGHLRVTSRQGAKALVGVWRDWWEREEFAPVLVELSTEEMERREVERTREARRTMRTLHQGKRRR